MSQNTFKKKIQQGSSPKGNGKNIFTMIEEKLNVTGILGEGVPVHFAPPFFFAAFFESIPLDMMRTPLTGDVGSGIHLSCCARSFIIAAFSADSPIPCPTPNTPCSTSHYGR